MRKHIYHYECCILAVCEPACVCVCAGMCVSMKVCMSKVLNNVWLCVAAGGGGVKSFITVITVHQDFVWLY